MKYTVTVRYRTTDVATKTFTVEAANQEEAYDEARYLFEADIENPLAEVIFEQVESVYDLVEVRQTRSPAQRLGVRTGRNTPTRVTPRVPRVTVEANHTLPWYLNNGVPPEGACAIPASSLGVPDNTYCDDEVDWKCDCHDCQEDDCGW